MEDSRVATPSDRNFTEQCRSGNRPPRTGTNCRPEENAQVCSPWSGSSRFSLQSRVRPTSIVTRHPQGVGLPSGRARPRARTTPGGEHAVPARPGSIRPGGNTPSRQDTSTVADPTDNPRPAHSRLTHQLTAGFAAHPPHDNGAKVYPVRPRGSSGQDRQAVTVRALHRFQPALCWSETAMSSRRQHRCRGVLDGAGNPAPSVGWQRCRPP